MRCSSQIKPVGYPKAVLQDVASYDEAHETLAFLELLAFGNRKWPLAMSGLLPVLLPDCAPTEPIPDEGHAPAHG